MTESTGKSLEVWSRLGSRLLVSCRQQLHQASTYEPNSISDCYLAVFDCCLHLHKLKVSPLSPANKHLAKAARVLTSQNHPLIDTRTTRAVEIRRRAEMAPTQLCRRQRARADLVLFLGGTDDSTEADGLVSISLSTFTFGVLHFYQTCTWPMAGQSGSREVHVLTESHGLVPESRCI
jgi:hypothetical protein